MASLQLNQAAIAAIAERIVQARRLYGVDSSYVIGMFHSLDLVLGEADASAARQQVQDQVVKLESSASGGRGAARNQEGKRAAAAAPAQAAVDGEAALAENTWIRGAVKWFNNDKGYGFISTAADADVFVHWRDISSWDRSLTQGDEVEFMVTKTAKGFQAINVMKPGAGGSDPSQGVAGSGAGTHAGPAAAEPDPAAPPAAPQPSAALPAPEAPPTAPESTDEPEETTDV